MTDGINSINVTNAGSSYRTTPSLGVSHGHLAGWMMAMIAFMNNMQAVTNTSVDEMQLSVTVEQAGEAQANYMINTVIDAPVDYTKSHDDQSVMGKIEWDEWMYGQNSPQADPQKLSNALQGDTPFLTIANTQYSQSSTFFSGIDNGVNQNSSDTTQTLQLDLQMAQSGPLSTLQTLSQVWR